MRITRGEGGRGEGRGQLDYLALVTGNTSYNAIAGATRFVIPVDPRSRVAQSGNRGNNANHLISSLKTAYNITTDIKDSNFCGLHLEWDYNNRWAGIHMPEYVRKTLIS